jgi:hypothetical protein
MTAKELIEHLQAEPNAEVMVVINHPHFNSVPRKITGIEMPYGMPIALVVDVPVIAEAEQRS